VLVGESVDVIGNTRGVWRVTEFDDSADKWIGQLAAFKSKRDAIAGKYTSDSSDFHLHLHNGLREVVLTSTSMASRQS
jgi:hypothetical protein